MPVSEICPCRAHGQYAGWKADDDTWKSQHNETDPGKVHLSLTMEVLTFDLETLDGHLS